MPQKPQGPYSSSTTKAALATDARRVGTADLACHNAGKLGEDWGGGGGPGLRMPRHPNAVRETGGSRRIPVQQRGTARRGASGRTVRARAQIVGILVSDSGAPRLRAIF
jgi:hypothetical protein